MKGNFFLGNKQFEVRELSLGPCGPDEVRIRNVAAGVCGTDIHIYHGEKGSADVKPPVVLGHEFSGIVEEIGSAVTTCKVGDLVTVDPNIYCGRCDACRNGKKQHCANLVAVGVNFNGGFAQGCKVPQSQVFSLPAGIDPEEAAFAEPLACCLHGIDLAQIRPGCSVCVIGGGTIGQIMVQLARLSGAGLVGLSEPFAKRREIALTLGADFVIDPMNEDPAESFRRQSGKDGADVVIECVGKTVATAQAFALAAKGATLLLFSVPSLDATYPLPLFDLFSKELKVIGSFINPDTHQRAVNLIASGRVHVKPLVTHRFPMGQVEEAIAMQQSSESIKVLVKP